MKIARTGSGWDRGYRRILGGIAATSLTIAAVIGLFTVLFQANLWATEKILITVALLGLSSALGLACEWARGARTTLLHQAVMVVGVIASLLGWALLMPSVWSWWPSYGSPGRDVARLVERIATICYFCSAAIAYDGVFHLMGFRGAAVWVRRIGCVGAYAVALTFSATIIVDHPDDDALRIIIAGAIVAGTAIIVAPVLRAIIPSMRLTPEVVLATDVIAPLTCPSCTISQRIVLGRKVHCTSCGLGIELKLDTPVCACGYDLAGLTTTKCPECGVEVPRKHAWALAPQADDSVPSVTASTSVHDNTAR